MRAIYAGYRPKTLDFVDASGLKPTVIPAKAGIQIGGDVVCNARAGLDSRLRGNDGFF